MNYYFCDACHYCFTAEMLLDRCPDCGKQEVHGRPAVRAATEAEIINYRRIQMELKEEELRTAGREAAGHESYSYISHRTDLRQSHIRL
mgnify:FL=1